MMHLMMFRSVYPPFSAGALSRSSNSVVSSQSGSRAPDCSALSLNFAVPIALMILATNAWLWGTASEYVVLYQYQLSGAKNIVMGMIQTESPYYQPTPNAPQPFRTGLFPDDPTLANCTGDATKCAVSWAVRIVDSSTMYVLGSGLYSWSNRYSQACVLTNDCQTRGLEVQESHDLWIYNLCTKAIVEMIGPVGAIPTYARDNVNGYLSSILAWLGGAESTTGRRKFKGYQLWTRADLEDYMSPETCRTAPMRRVACDDEMRSWVEPSYRGVTGNVTLTNSMRDAGCGESLQSWFKNIDGSCKGYNISTALPTLLGGRVWAGYNETCLKPTDGKNRDCNGEQRRMSYDRGIYANIARSA